MPQKNIKSNILKANEGGQGGGGVGKSPMREKAMFDKMLKFCFETINRYFLNINMFV